MDVPALSVYALPGTWWSWLLWQIWKFLQGSRSLSEGRIMHLTAIVFKGQEKKKKKAAADFSKWGKLFSPPPLKNI